MTFPAAIPSVLFLLLAAFTAGAGAATFTITSRCSFVVCPAAFPIGGGTQLSQGQTWTLQLPAGTSSARIWGRTGCSFGSDGRGSCQTGDCAGVLSCTLSGNPPTTLAEITLGKGGDMDNYGISVVDGFNVPMAMSCSTGGAALQCSDSSCPDANHRSDEGKYHTCKGNSDYQVVFCP